MSHVRQPTEVQRALAARGDAVDLLEQMSRRPARSLGLAPVALPQLVPPQPAAPRAAQGSARAPQQVARVPTAQPSAASTASRRRVWIVAALILLVILTIASATWAASRSTAAVTTGGTTAQPPATAPGISGAAVPNVAAQPGLPRAVVPSSDFRYDAPPSISRDDYIAIYCLIDSPACPEAGTMYDILVTLDEEGIIDPAIEAAQGMHETGLGTAQGGVGRLPTLRTDGSVDPCCGGRNLHGVQCFPGDARVADLAVGWGNGCAGVYPDYATSVRTWKGVILREYVAEGKDTPAKAVWKYAPIGKDGNNPPAYIADMENWISCWRAKGPKACYAERGIAVRQ